MPVLATLAAALPRLTNTATRHALEDVVRAVLRPANVGADAALATIKLFVTMATRLAQAHGKRTKDGSAPCAGTARARRPRAVRALTRAKGREGANGVGDEAGTSGCVGSARARASVLLCTLLAQEHGVVEAASTLGTSWTDLLEGQALLYDTLFPAGHAPSVAAIQRRLHTVVRQVGSAVGPSPVAIGATFRRLTAAAASLGACALAAADARPGGAVRRRAAANRP